jgi:hypothetical protein
MNTPKTILDIENLIKDKVEESLHLEYKAAGALKNSDPCKSEIAKDVSAMANSDGVTIIYGIAEFSDSDKKHLPEKISPINRTEFSKEWLENVINSNISPKIEGLLITPIPLENEQEVVYVVDIPKSTTAHQNTRDFKYYRRYNFSVLSMLAHEIQDVMNRNKHPEIRLDFIIERYTSIKTTEIRENELAKYQSIFPKTSIQTSVSDESTFFLKCTPFNEGKVFANYINYHLKVTPADVFLKLKLNQIDETKEIAIIFGDNTVRDLAGFVPNTLGPGTPQYGPSRFVPVLPNTRGYAKEIRLNPDYIYMDAEIEWIVYADNALPKTGKIKLNDVVLKERHGIYEE